MYSIALSYNEIKALKRFTEAQKAQNSKARFPICPSEISLIQKIDIIAHSIKAEEGRKLFTVVPDGE